MKKYAYNKFQNIITIFYLTTLFTFITNIIFNFSATHKERLFKNSGKIYNWNFGKIYYKQTGTGTPLLLIHDLSVYASSFEWSKIVKKLAEKHTVYTIDLLGCGLSDKPSITYTNYLYVKLLEDFIQNVIRTKANVIASNNSSSIIITTIQSNRNLFNKIIFINPPSINKSTTISFFKVKMYKFIIATPIFGTFVFNISTNKYLLKSLFKKYYFYNLTRCSSKIIDTYYESAHIGKENAKFLYASLIGNYTAANINHVLKQLSHKITIIGSRDLNSIDSIINNYCCLNPYIEFEIIENSKSLPHLENPETILTIIDKYI